MTLQAHQQRVVAEQKELCERIAKLTAFIAGEKFKEVARAEGRRLIRQLQAMEQYEHVLLERIAAFKG
jgi:hypothetical protein